MEKGGIISNDQAIAESFNTYFSTITHRLDIKEWPATYSWDGLQSQTEKAILKAIIKIEVE